MTDELYHHQRRAGGVEPPAATDEPQLLYFGDAAAEYRAARESAAIFDLSDRTRLEFTGAARQKFLHSYCTNVVEGLPVGGGCEAFVTSLKGRILDHVWIAVDEQSVVLDAAPDRAKPLVDHLGKYAMLEDVEIADRMGEFSKLFVTGPDAARVLGLDDLPCDGCRRIDLLGDTALVHRTDFLGSTGFVVAVRTELAVAAWNALTFQEAVPAGRYAFDALRVEAGWPRFGVDVSDENIAQEAARTERAISFTKGCYLGQEPIHRLFAMGHTNRELRVVEIDGDVVPEVGSTVLDGDRDVGRLTSVTVVPGDERVVALGTIRVKSGSTGHELQVEGSPARIVEPYRSEGPAE